MIRLFFCVYFGLCISGVLGGVASVPVVERFNMTMPSTNFWSWDSSGDGRIQVVHDEDKGFLTNTVPSSTKGLSSGTLTNYFVGNYFTCSSNAVLQGFSVLVSNKNKSATYTLRVYGPGKDNMGYSLLRSTNIITSVTGAVTIDSGDLDLNLINGRYYVLGIGYSGSFGVSMKSKAFPGAMLFGSATSGVSYTSAVPLVISPSFTTSTDALYMKVKSSTEGVLRMDSSVNGSMSTNALVVNVNLANNPSAYLSFRYRESGDEPHAADGVLLSTNGTAWYRLVNIEQTNTAWHNVETNLSLFAQSKGLTLGSQTRIMFRQVDDYPWSTDGREFDDIVVYSLPDLNYKSLDITNAVGGTKLLLKGIDVDHQLKIKSTIGWAGSSDALATIPISYKLSDNVATYAITSSWNCGFSAYGVQTNEQIYSFDIPAGDILSNVLFTLSSVVNPTSNFVEKTYANNNASDAVWYTHYSGVLYFDSIRTDVTLTDFNFRGSAWATEQSISGTGIWRGVGFSFTNLPVVKNLSTLNYSLDPAATNTIYLDVTNRQESGGVYYWYTNGVTLSTNGAMADIKVRLPQGMGVSDDQDNPMMSPFLTFQQINLNTYMTPNTITNVGPWYVSEETKPLKFHADEIIWQRASSHFYLPNISQVDYVHKTQEQMLEYSGSKYMKKSNEGYYRYVQSVSSTNYIRCSTTAGARMEFAATLDGGTNIAFMPYGAVIRWNGGYLDVYNDLVRTNSLLDGVRYFGVSYAIRCPSDPCGYDGKNREMIVVPEDDKLYFTRRGGLDGAVLVPDDPNNGNVYWGVLNADYDYAQSVITAFTNGSFFMPGHFSDAAMTVFDDELDREPSVLLLSGVMPTNRWSYELHGTTAATNGLADYAGVNLRVSEEPREMEGRSIIGHTADPVYPLTERSKYYLRYSGVSGIHEAQADQFPSGTMKLYDYPVVMTNYALSYLSNSNVGSRTEGSLYLSYPSDFTLEFEEMKFTCLGDLDQAEVSEESELLKLKYWNAHIMPYAMRFAAKDAGDCSSYERFLMLGVGTYCANVDEQLFGVLGFESDGNLIPPSFGHPDTGSRLSPPSVMTVDGPRNEIYSFYPVSEIYYNNHDYEVDDTRNGFITVAGELDVPFFENLMVQLQTSASTNSANAPIYMMGGWPTDGWQVNGADYFDVTLFDTNNAAFPVGEVSLKEYQAGSDGYKVRALRDWLGVVNLDYPLDYDPNTRSFESADAVTNDFIVLKTEHQVDYLSAENAELSFGLQYDGLPQINLANIAFEAVDAVTGGASDIFSGTLEKLWEPILDGIDSLDSLLSALPQDLMGHVVDDVVDDVVDTLYQQLSISYQADPASYYSNNVAKYVRGVGAVDSFTIQARFGMMMTGGASLNVSVVETMTNYLNKVETLLNSFGTGITVDGSQVAGLLHIDGTDYPVMEQLANNVLGALANEVVSQIGSELEPQIAAVMGEMTNSLQTLNATIDEMRSAVTNLQYRVGVDAQLDIYQQLDASIDASVISTVCSNAAQRIDEMFSTMAAQDIEFTSYSEEEMKTLLKNAIKDEFYACSIPTDIAQIMREQVYDLNSSIQSACDSVFARINGAIREVMSQYLSEIDDSINGMLGEISDFVGSGQINGYGHINNDSLVELRLDAALQWKVPDDLNFNGYLIIREVQSGSPESCGGGSEKAKEVILGTDAMGIEWISDIKVDIMTKFTFKGDDWTPVGLAGSFAMVEGVIGFESFELTEFAAGAGFGLYENYISAAARAHFSSYEVAGGAFFGRACSLEPILLWDKDVEQVLGAAPFTGFYVYGEGWMPIVDWGCVFNVRGGVGAGLFMFLEGPTIGGKIFVGVEGEALCVVDVGGDVTVVGSKSGDDLIMVGKGRVKGKAGKCPFCVKFKKTVKLTYKNGSWDADY